MTSNEFCHWLRGYLQERQDLTPVQLQLLRQQLTRVADADDAEKQRDILPFRKG